MQRRGEAGNGRMSIGLMVVLGISALAAIVSLVANHLGSDDPRVSQVAPSAIQRPAEESAPDAARPAAAAQPAFATHADAIRAATRLVASAFSAFETGEQPTMREILLAAEDLVEAGVIEPPPTLAESLVAADLLIKAGAMPAPEPSLAEVLQSVDVMIRDGALPATDDWRNQVLIAIAEEQAALQSAASPSDDTVAPPPPRPAAPPPPPTATPAPPPPPAPAPTGDGWYDAGFQQAVFEGVNARRMAAGLAPLTFEPRLAQAAGGYAQTLAIHSHFSHTGPDGSSLVDRVTATGFPFDVMIGEVIAWGTQGWTPEGVVQAWIDSPSHRAQVLEPTYRRAGVGCYFTIEGGVDHVRCVMDLAG